MLWLPSGYCGGVLVAYAFESLGNAHLRVRLTLSKKLFVRTIFYEHVLI